MNILITGAWQYAEEALPAIRAMGHEIAFLKREDDALPCPATWVEGVIGNHLFSHHPIESFPKLRYVQITSAGFDHMPTAYMRARGIVFRTAKDVYSIPMAEYAVGGVLWLYKRMRAFDAKQRSAIWEKDRSLIELCGKTVLILGCGSVGTACAERFRAFGCRVIGLATKAREHKAFDAIRPIGELDGMLPNADVAVLALPLTEETRGIMDARRLDLMNRHAILVNISRGGIVDQNALEERIDNIGGAVLDVFEPEPLPESSPLWTRENVIITPHNSFAGDGNRECLNGVILRNLKEIG